MSAFDALGVKVFALGYDEPDALKDFQDAYGITYTFEIIQVHHNLVELRLPITANTALTSATETMQFKLSGEIASQTCDDAACDVPQRLWLTLKLPVEGSVVSEFMAQPGNPRIREMDGLNHFKKMTSRRHS